MKGTDYHDGVKRRINPDYFTGSTALAELTGRLGAKKTRIYHVDFSGGAATKLHTHTGAQLLIATGGGGYLAFYKKTGAAAKETRRIPLKAGGMAYIDPGVLHAHGSSGRGKFSHIAINFPTAAGAESKAVWYESDPDGRISRI